MKNLYLSIAFVTALLLFSAILIADDTGKSGKLEMSERVFDFGMLPREAKVTHTFILKNIGNDTIHITNIKPGCSCTAAPIDKEVIAVNDSAIMPVTFSTGRQSGETAKGVKITTDMKPRGLFPLEIKAYIESPTGRPPKFFAEPRTIEFVRKMDQLSGTAGTTLKNELDHDVLVKIVDYTDNLGTPKLAEDKIKTGQSSILTFDFRDDENMRPEYGSITLEVLQDEREVMRYTVPVIRMAPVKE